MGDVGYFVTLFEGIQGLWNYELKDLGIAKKTMNEQLGLRFRTTFGIIEAAERGLLPDKIMITTHPQRWDDRFGPWVRPGETLLRRMLSACFTG